MRRVRASVVAAGPRHLTPSSNCLLLGFRGSVVPVRHFRSAVVAPAAEEAGEGGSANVLSDNPLFASVQEIEVEGSAINKAGAIVEVIARGGGTEIVQARIDPSLAGNASEQAKLLTQAAQDAYEQVQYAVKRKLVEGSMSARRQQQLKEKEQMHFDLGSFKEKK